jgi:dUTPase
MKIIKKENVGILPVYNTNVKDVHNYVGSKAINHNCVVDFEYQGEIHINVINTSSKVVRIYAGQKLMQFLETPIFTSTIEEVKTLENLYKGATSRGPDGFGSTDKEETK